MPPGLQRAFGSALLLIVSTAGCGGQRAAPGASTPAPAHTSRSSALVSLAGKRVLAILVPEQDPRAAYFVAGPARWTGAALEVAVDSATTIMLPVGRGFPPAMLPKLIVPEHLAQVQAVARDADAAVAIFTRAAPPPGALKLEMAFFGLARSANGEALLMVGEP